MHDTLIRDEMQFAARLPLPTSARANEKKVSFRDIIKLRSAALRPLSPTDAMADARPRGRRVGALGGV